mgnify:CR=1 FL=1
MSEQTPAPRPSIDVAAVVAKKRASTKAIVSFFKEQSERTGKGYQTLINEVLAAMQPRLHLYGHHHRFVEMEREGKAVRHLGTTITYCGPSGTGQLTKLVNQILVSITNMATCEALVFARRNGLDLEKTGVPAPGWFNDPSWSKPALTALVVDVTAVGSVRPRRARSLAQRNAGSTQKSVKSGMRPAVSRSTSCKRCRA